MKGTSDGFPWWRPKLFVKGPDAPRREPPERVYKDDEEILDLLMQNIVLEARIAKLTDQIACVERYITYRNDAENLGKEALSLNEWYEKHVLPQRRA